MAITDEQAENFLQKSLQRKPLSQACLLILKEKYEDEAKYWLTLYNNYLRQCRTKAEALEQYEQCVNIIVCLTELLDARRLRLVKG